MISKLLMVGAVVGIANAATIVLDDFSTVTTGGSVANNIDVAQGCNGPTTAAHSGASILGGSGQRLLATGRTAGSGCIQAAVSSGQFVGSIVSGLATGVGVVLGIGPMITVLPTDLIQFDASYTGTLSPVGSVTLSLRPASSSPPALGDFISGTGVSVASGTATTFQIPVSALGITAPT